MIFIKYFKTLSVNHPRLVSLSQIRAILLLCPRHSLTTTTTRGEEPYVAASRHTPLHVMLYNPWIYLIHVGKAGGTTLNRALGLSGTLNLVKCMANNSLVSKDSSSCYIHSLRASQLERLTLGYYHMWGFGLDNEERKWLLSITNVFLFTVCKPIDRLILVHNFHRQLFCQGNADNNYPKCYKAFPMA